MKASMENRRTLKELIERLRTVEGPVLSLYLSLVPDDDARSTRTAQTRAASTMQKLGVPSGIRDRVLRALEDGPVHGRVAAIFANGGFMEIVSLDIDLPIVDPITGQAESQWGAPLVMPLELALERHGDAAAIYVDQERVRIFDVSLGHAREIGHEMRLRGREEYDRLEESKTIHPAHIADRGSSANQDAVDHVADLTDRFYDRIAEGLPELLGQSRIILMGPDPFRGRFEKRLGGGIRNQICGRIGALSSPEAPESEVQARVAPVLDGVDREAEERLLDDIADHGVRGVDECLELLQRGRLAQLAVPWRVDREVYVDPKTGFAATTADRARANGASDGEVETHPLRDELRRLARAFGAEVRFVTGEHRERIEHDFEGMGGIRRW